MASIIRDYAISSGFSSSDVWNAFQSALSDLGWLSTVDLGVTRITALNGALTISGRTGISRHICTGSNTSLTGAIPPGVAIRRDGNYYNGIYQLTTGSGWEGRGTQIGTYTQNDSTNVTITLKAHGLSTGDNIFIQFSASSGIAPGDYIYTITKIDNNTISISTSTGTSDGSITAYGCTGNYTVITNECTVISPDHRLVDNSYIYITGITGGINTGLYQINVIDVNTFSFQNIGSNTSGILVFNHTFKITGSQFGGIDGVNDIRVRIDRCLGNVGSSSAIIDAGSTAFNHYSVYDYMVFKSINDSSKIYGSQFVLVSLSDNTLGISNTPVWDPQSQDIGNNNSSNEVHVHPFCSTFTCYNTTSDSFQIRTWQSELDADFAIFSFYQFTTNYGNFIFHKFKPLNTAPFTLDQLAIGGYTRIESGTSLLIKTQVNVGKNCAESYYCSLNSEQEYAFNDAYNVVVSNINGAGGPTYDIYSSKLMLYANTQYPYNGNFGPLVYRFPLNPNLAPSFYNFPDDFGFINTTKYALSVGDTITVTPGLEVYQVIAKGVNSGNASYCAFVARTV